MVDTQRHPERADMATALTGRRLAASPVVSSAHRALIAFGGSELTRAQARTLLALWTHEPTLTPAEAAAVLARFPEGEDELPSLDLPPMNPGYDQRW